MTIISNSPNITKLDATILYDLSATTPQIVITNASTGANLAGCTWWYEIRTPSNTYIHKGTQGSPDITGTWTTRTVPDAWPKPFGQIEWSGIPYVFTLYVRDSVGTVNSMTVNTPILRPHGSLPARTDNFGEAALYLEVRCDRGQIYVEDKTPYSYNGITGTSTAQKYTLVYPPDDTDVVPAPFELTGYSTALLPITFSAPCYLINYSSTMLYDMGDGALVKIKYKFRKEFAVACDIDLCPLMCDYAALLDKYEKGSCSAEMNQKVPMITGLLTQAIIGKMQPLCGVNVGEIVERIKKLGGFSCNCSMGGAGIKASSASGELNVTFTTCGDIIASAQVDGQNINLTLKDTKYIFKICDDSDLQDAFQITSTYDAQTCTRTFCLKVIESELPTGGGGGGTAMPVYIPVWTKGDTDPPLLCPAPWYPMEVWTPNGVTNLGAVASRTELYEKVIGDNSTGGYASKGTWIAATDCTLVLYPAPSVSTTNLAVLVAPLALPPGNCVNNQKSYTQPIAPYGSGGTGVWGESYPTTVYVKFGPSPTLYTITNVQSMPDMIAKLNALVGRPSNIIFGMQPPGTIGSILVTDFDCSDNTVISIEADSAVGDIAYTAASNNLGLNASGSSGGGLISGVVALDLNGMTQLPFVPTTRNEQIPWHIIRRGNVMLTVETNKGKLFHIDISNPLYPIATAVFLTKHTANGYQSFSGGPSYNGNVLTPSHYDVYFPTDLSSTGGDFAYILESSSGGLWKYQISTMTEVAHLQDDRLIGLCPRVIVNNVLWCSMDGLRGTQLPGLTSTSSRGTVVGLDLATVGGTFATITMTAVTAAIGASEAWAITWDATNGVYWITLVNGTLIRFNPLTVSLVAYTGQWSVVGGFSGVVNTHLFGNRLYASCSGGKGTRYLDIASGSLTPGAVTVFDLFNDSAGTVMNDHYNFQVITGKNYGLLTFQNGVTSASRGGVAKFSLDGKFQGLIQFTTAGGCYNVIPILGVGAITPNGLSAS